MSTLANDLKNFCYDWEMRKALKVRLHFKGEAACVAFASLWEFFPWGTNTVILEQKDMELVTVSSVYVVYMETMSVF